MADEYYLHQWFDRANAGHKIGWTSSDKISFYGATPAARSALSNAAVATTLAISTTTTQWAYSTSTQANALVALVNELRAKLVALGLTS